METANNMEALYEFIRLLARRRGLDPEKAVEIYKMILTRRDSKGLSDEDIVNKTGYRQSEVRKILRLFYELRLASYRRGRHPETGATRYYWYVDLTSVNNSLRWRKIQVLEKLKARLEYERSNTFYRCPTDGSRYTFDEAFEREFRCPKCDSVLEEEDNSWIIEVLEREIARLEEEIRRDEELLRTH